MIEIPTPETDAEASETYQVHCDDPGSLAHADAGLSCWVDSDFARSLERRLAVATEALKAIDCYPVHSEPVGGALDMKEKAYTALNRIEELRGEKP